jgi:hypothetical protein
MGDETMDSFDLKPERKIKINAKSLIWNLLTVLILIGIACQGYMFLSIFMNPKLVPPILRPQPLPTLFATVTSTITPRQLAPTWTNTWTTEPSATRTRAPTWTPLPGMISATITETPTQTVEPTITATPTIASASIVYRPSTDFYLNSDCKWLGVGGEVLDANNQPLQYQTLQLGGKLNDKNVQDLVNLTLTLSGMDPKSPFGKSGFVFQLGDTPVDSTQTLWIQLFDNTSQPLTDKVYFDTFTDCTKNLVYITFTKTR